MLESEFDVNGYPTEKTLATISNWKIRTCEDALSLLEFVKNAWFYPDAVKVKENRYSFSTGGWSGNEDLINSLVKNRMFWESSQKGGHYEFEVRGI